MPKFQAVIAALRNGRVGFIGLVLILTACRRQDDPAASVESLPPLHGTNALLTEIKHRMPFRLVRTNNITNLLADLESSVNQFSLQTKSSNELEQLAKQLYESNRWEDSFQVSFYAKLRQLQNENANPVTNAAPMKPRTD